MRKKLASEDKFNLLLFQAGVKQHMIFM